MNDRTIFAILFFCEFMLIMALSALLFQKNKTEKVHNTGTNDFEPFTIYQCTQKCRQVGADMIEYNPYSFWYAGTPISDRSDTAPCMCGFKK